MSPLGSFDPAEGEPERTFSRRNARGRFRLTERGCAALREYRDAVEGARRAGDRVALDEAKDRWARPLGLEATDALVLDELETIPRSILELSRSLDTCGLKRPAIQSGIDRLAQGQLIELATPPPREPAGYPPPRY